jgi:hypothetical protein
MLRREITEQIAIVAADPRVQACCMSAMFNECERGTDIWEMLEEDIDYLPTRVREILFGDADNAEEETGLHVISPPNEVVEEMLDQIEAQVRKKLLGARDNYCVRCTILLPCDCPE